VPEINATRKCGDEVGEGATVGAIVGMTVAIGADAGVSDGPPPEGSVPPVATVSAVSVRMAAAWLTRARPQATAVSTLEPEKLHARAANPRTSAISSWGLARIRFLLIPFFECQHAQQDHRNQGAGNGAGEV
jgi:hypothetical protein